MYNLGLLSYCAERGRTAQWVQRRTEMPGTILTRVRFSGIFLPNATFSTDFLTVIVQLRRAIARTNILLTLKITNTDSHISLSGHTKILHTLVGMGIA